MVAKKPKKFEIAQQFFAQLHSNAGFRVLDIGATGATEAMVREIIGGYELIQLNIERSHLGNASNGIVGDGNRMPFQNGSIDAVMCFDVIEHIIEPDNLIAEANRVLKKDGILIIATVNLANIYNRLLLLCGFSPLTYSPAGYKVGLPFPPVKSELGHKSVFTFKGLRDLLTVYKFKIVKSAGYCYYEPSYTGYERNEVGFFKLRVALDKILPKEMQEGMMFLSKKT